MGWKIDEKIPVIPEFIVIYCSWFVFLLFVPLLLWHYDAALCVRYLAAYVLDQLLSFVVFLLYPTTFTRPEPAGKGLLHFMFCTVYGANHRFLNCIPSLHCSVALLYAFAALACPLMPLWLRAFLVIIGLLICASTVFVKQHMLVDVITAVPAALLCWILAGLLPTARIAAALGL